MGASYTTCPMCEGYGLVKNIEPAGLAALRGRLLAAAIAAYVDARNADPKPFRWTKTADDILASIERFCRRTVAVQAQCG